MNTVFVVAGEVSGDLQAAHLVAEVRRRNPRLAVVGIGGSHLAAAGATVLHDSTTWGVIGHVDPVLHLRTYLRRLAQVEAAVRAVRPALLALVDFPAFNLRLAERLRRLVPILYYFPPMVSVRTGDRARNVARLQMRLLATLKREADAYRAAGADVVFIGHPVVDLARPRWSPTEIRAQFDLRERSLVVGLLPGSRLQEIRAHLPIMLDAAKAIRSRAGDVEFVLPVPAAELRAAIDAPVRASRLAVRMVSETYDAMAVSTVLLAAAGTATLEAAVLGVPMVAMYRLPWLSWVIARRVVSVRYAALPNILAGREIVPELLQDDMTAANVADAVTRLLLEPARREMMRRDLAAVASDLGGPGAIGRAADEVMHLLVGVATAQ